MRGFGKFTPTKTIPRVRTIKARIDELAASVGQARRKVRVRRMLPTITPVTPFILRFRKLPLLGVTYADLYQRTRRFRKQC